MARDVNKSPFPGMDPYLEQSWPDVHHGLCTYSRDKMRQSLPAGLVARVEERMIVLDELGDERPIYPDVSAVDLGKRRHFNQIAVASLSEPVIINSEPESIVEGFIQVIDTRDHNRVVTAIEFASPANKVSIVGRKMYRQKQRELLSGGVSLVEVDLVRAGEWNLLAPKHRVKDRSAGLYHVCVTRAWQHRKQEVYAIGLPDTLPTIKVPLRQGDQDATLDLQAMLSQVYVNGDYGQSIDYGSSPIPPLSDADQKWVQDWLATH